ncbi:MAG: hypothetical protein BWY66_01113 [bacterium ADurb.Bin374]|nr:MAG: hypothetical protein BWY66_01113 [bacterium ADurb.Bin374]
MIDALTAENFTVFKKNAFSFSRGLNVLIGENSTGKSLLLKLNYCFLRALFECRRVSGEARSKSMVLEFEKRLTDVFKPESLGSLIHRGKATKSNLVFSANGGTCSMDLGPNYIDCHGSEIADEASAPVFIPPKEILSFFQGFTSLYDLREISIDGTYNDLCLSVNLPELREKHREKLLMLIQELEEAIGGRIIIEEGRVYFLPKRGKKLEVNLLAEGYRKLGMIALLIRSGGIAAGKTLFWDEPEANLNPRLISLLAKALIVLARNGVQLFLATHSLFLTRELVIQESAWKNGGAAPRYFALARKGDGVVVSQGDSIDDIEPLALLDADLEQSGRYLDLIGG